jgi:hypothetical protein
MEKAVGVMQSRKFWAALVAIVLAMFGERAGVDGDSLTAAIGVIIAYITGTALEEGLTNRYNGKG